MLYGWLDLQAYIVYNLCVYFMIERILEYSKEACYDNTIRKGNGYFPCHIL